MREASVTPEYDYLKYDSNDWKLSWTSVISVGLTAAAIAAVLWLIVATR